MIYAVGTGRCGTKSYADMLGGEHEPDPDFKFMALDYYQTKVTTDKLIDSIKDRAAVNSPCISDNKQTFVMELIKEHDKEARFVWLIRDPISCITSFLRRSEEYEQFPRVKPRRGFPKEYDVFDRILWMYLEKNKLIEKSIKGTKFDVVHTNTLQVKSNPGPYGTIKWKDKWIDKLEREAMPYWTYVKKEYL